MTFCSSGPPCSGHSGVTTETKGCGTGSQHREVPIVNRGRNPDGLPMKRAGESIPAGCDLVGKCADLPELQLLIHARSDAGRETRSGRLDSGR